MRSCALRKRATFHAGGNLKAQLLPILHNVYADSSRARYAEVQRLAGAGELVLVEPQLPAGRTIMYAYANFDRRSSTYRKSSARLCISLRLRALTYVEAAAAVGVPAGTLMSRIARPRGRAESYRR
jgi:RNA polymerase sigma-70 factor (ECF subfamily)